MVGPGGSLRLVAEGGGGSPWQQDRAWPPGQVPPPQPGAGQLGSIGAAPAPGSEHVPGDWGWDKAGLGNGPAGGIHVPHQQRTWSVMGIAAQHLQQSSGGGQAGQPQLKSRSQAKAVSKCMQMLQPY